jgi:hypothetical protein
MGRYRPSRNFEATIIDYIKDSLDITDWTGISVEKSFNRVYDLPVPVICVRVENTIHEKIEIGDNYTIRNAIILIDIFASSDGQRLDLKDFLIEKLKNGMPYYEYIIEEGRIIDKIYIGRLNVISISDTPIDFNVDKSNLDKHDRCRHLLTLTVTTSKVEE